MFSPIVSLPLTCDAGNGLNPLYCATSASVLAEIGLGGFRAPPVAKHAVRIELAALVVEAVAHLVADDRADRTVIDRRIGVRIEERRLQDRRREGDLVGRAGCSKR